MSSSQPHVCPGHHHQSFGSAADDYEALPGNTNFSIGCTAGAIAGMAEHCLVYPLDFIKTRLMMATKDKNATNSMRKVLADAIKFEGCCKPIRGVSLVLFTSGPAHALYFGAYEAVKLNMRSYGSFGHATGAVCATLLHDAIMVPSDTVKQRIQAAYGQSLTVPQCLKDILRNEGFLALYRSYVTHVAMTLPFHVTHFVTYEMFQNTFNPHREYRPMSHVIGGAIAGSMGAAITNPLDVCKTLLNTQQPLLNGEKAKNLRHAVSLILKSEGSPMFFRGIHARMIYAAPSTAISWSVYELFKHLLADRSRDTNIDT